MGLNCFTSQPKVTVKKSNLKGCKKKTKKKDKSKKVNLV